MRYYTIAFVLFIVFASGIFYFVNKEVNKTITETNVLAPPVEEPADVNALEEDTTLIGGNYFPLDFVDTVNYEVVDGYTFINWTTLSRVQFKEEYVDSMGMYVPFPVFHPTVKKYNGQPIQMKGYIIPIEETGDEDILVLSANPFANCFFCGNAGPETIMDIKLKKKLRKRLKQDAVVTFRGKLKLNDSDLYYLNYILEDAEVVKIEK